MTVVRPVAAFFSAFFAGVMEDMLVYEDSEEVANEGEGCSCRGESCEKRPCPQEEERQKLSFWGKVMAGLRFSVTDVWADLAGWFLVGILIGGIIAALVPANLLSAHLGGGVGSMFLMLAAGIPIYICATASTPVAAALIMKGVSPGTALVFLLAGPATNMTSLSVITGILGKRGTVVYLLSLSVCAIVCGLALDMLYISLGISARAVIGQAPEVLPSWLKISGAIVLLALSVKPLAKKFQKVVAGKGEGKDTHDNEKRC